MTASCTVCGVAITKNGPYRGMCSNCATSATAAQGDVHANLDPRAAFSRLARLRQVGLGVGVASVLTWIIQMGMFCYGLVASETLTPLYLSFVLALCQICLTLTTGIIVRKVRLLAQHLGVPRVSTGSIVTYFVIGAVGSVGTLGLGALGSALYLFSSAMAHGRPVRVSRRQILPSALSAAGWTKGPQPDTSKLDRATRDALAELWLQDAKAEYASVPAFAQVAWQLAALGASPELLVRANHCALQEIDHAQRCFALASAYAGRPLRPAPMPALARGMARLPKDRARALAAVAREAFVDGALLESFSAALARRPVTDADDSHGQRCCSRTVSPRAPRTRRIRRRQINLRTWESANGRLESHLRTMP